MINVEHRESSIEGLGVFARRSFEVGETLLVLDASRVVDDEHPLRPDLGEDESHCTVLGDGSVVLLPEPERYLNHSCDPNAFLRSRGREVHVIARCRILSGDEVTLDYLINTHGGTRWRCLCGAPGCRGLLEASFFDLPTEIQRDYLPLLEDWFVAAHQAEVRRLVGEVGPMAGSEE